MKTHAVREYVNFAPITDDPEGDFIGDARRDRGFPDVRSWSELKGYLRTRGACREAIVAARAIWRQYRRDAKTTRLGPPHNPLPTKANFA